MKHSLSQDRNTSFRSRNFYLAIGIIGLLSMGAVGIDSGGVRFPDGTFQTTAASAQPEAWPMHCDNTSLDIDASSALTCLSVLAVPGGSFGPGDGVPAGFFFLVTDVYLEPATNSVETGFIGIELKQMNNLDIEVRRLEFKLPGDLPSGLFSFRAPNLILTEGDYLETKSFPGSTKRMAVHVSGFLTAAPQMLSL